MVKTLDIVVHNNTQKIELGNLVLKGVKASKIANEIVKNHKAKNRIEALDRVMDFKPKTITNGSIQGAWLMVIGNRKN
jgi:hypothetical protein